MARKDRTFTDKDIIRLVNKNLSNEEFVHVIIELCKGIKIESFDHLTLIVTETATKQGIKDIDFITLLIKLIAKLIGK